MTNASLLDPKNNFIELGGVKIRHSKRNQVLSQEPRRNLSKPMNRSFHFTPNRKKGQPKSKPGIDYEKVMNWSIADRIQTKQERRMRRAMKRTRLDQEHIRLVARILSVPLDN